MNDSEKLEQLLREQEIMVLAVTLDDGTPWATPVKIQLQWGSAFEWDSKLDTEHSRAIAARPQIAVTVFKKDDDHQTGFYAIGTAECVEEKPHGLGRYRFVATKAWLNDETFKKREIDL